MAHDTEGFGSWILKESPMKGDLVTLSPGFYNVTEVVLMTFEELSHSKWLTVPVPQTSHMRLGFFRLHPSLLEKIQRNKPYQS
jgi:hypothetical protein